MGAGKISHQPRFSAQLIFLFLKGEDWAKALRYNYILILQLKLGAIDNQKSIRIEIVGSFLTFFDSYSFDKLSLREGIPTASTGSASGRE